MRKKLLVKILYSLIAVYGEKKALKMFSDLTDYLK